MRRAKLIRLEDLQMKVAPDEGWRDPREQSPIDDETVLRKAYAAEPGPTERRRFSNEELLARLTRRW